MNGAVRNRYPAVPSVKVHVFDNPLSSPLHRVVFVPADGVFTIAEAILQAVDVKVMPDSSAGILEHAAVVLNGKSIRDHGDEELFRPIRQSDTLHVSPATPGDFGIGEIILVIISLASAAASYLLTPKIRSDAENPSDGDKRFAFGRYSRAAVRGEPIPLVLGEHEKYGPPKVVAVPGEGQFGDSTLKLLFVLAGHRVHRIGSRLRTDGDANNLAPGTGAGKITGIFLNDQPIENFPSAKVSVRFGASGQAPIPGFKDTETPREVAAGSSGAVLVNTSGSDRTGSDTGEAVTYTSVDPVDAVVLRVRFAQGLYALSQGGQVQARRVQYRHQWRLYPSGSWSAWTVETVERSEQSEFVVAPRIDDVTPGSPPARIEVRVQRVTPDANSTTVADEMRLLEVVEVVYAQNRYVGCALLALVLTAGEQLTSEPRISLRIAGYDGLRIWDGVSDPSTPTFTTGYSNNPADIMLGVLTDPVLCGEGSALDDQDVDIPALLEARTRCAELVDRPAASPLRASKGPTRPRHSCNMLISDLISKQDVLLSVAKTMWASVVVADKVRVIQDRPRASPVEVFTDGSIQVLDGGLKSFATTYTSSRGGKQTANQIRVQFDNAAAGETDIVTFPAAGNLWLGGDTPEPVNAATEKLEGVTDSDEVLAFAIYTMKMRRLRDRSTTFTTTSPWIRCQPMDRIDVACSVSGWGIASGRLSEKSVALAGTALVLDRDLVIEDSASYAVTVKHLDDTLEVSPLSLTPGVYPAGTPITLDVPLATTPAFGSEYSVGFAGTQLVPRQVTKIRRVDKGGGASGSGSGESSAGNASSGSWEISIAPYDASVYAPEPADVLAADFTTIGAERSAPGPVTSLVLTERRINGQIVGVGLSWRQQPLDRVNTASFRLYRRSVGSTFWQLVPGVSAGLTGADLSIVDPNAAVEFRVVAVSALGQALSVYDDRHITVGIQLGLGQPAPEAPGSLTITQDAGNVYNLTWDAVDGAAGYQVLFGGDTGTGKPNDGAEDCFPIARTVGNSLGGLILPSGRACRFYVRAVNTAGRLSDGSATAEVASPGVPAGRSVKDTYVADLSAHGTFTNASWIGGSSIVRITDADDAAGGVWESSVIDTESVTSTQLTVRLKTKNDAEDLDIGDSGFAAMGVPSIEADQWGIVSGTGASAVIGMRNPPYPDFAQSWLVELRTSIDSLTFTSYEAIGVGQAIERTMQYYQIRVTMKRTVGGSAYRPALCGVAVVAVH